MKWRLTATAIRGLSLSNHSKVERVSLPAKTDVKLHASPAARLIYVGIGLLSTSLGILGMFLPLLPTTPLILLAAFCFSRSSPRFHAALITNRYLGPPLLQWQQKRCIDSKIRNRAIVIVMLTFAISIAVIDVPGLSLMLLLICVSILAGLSLIPLCNQPRQQ